MHGKFVGVTLLVDDARNAAVYYHFGADRARLVRAVQRGAHDAHSHTGSLNDGVLLGVRGVAQFVLRSAGYVELAAKTLALFLARLDSATGAVVTGGEDSLILGR